MDVVRGAGRIAWRITVASRMDRLAAFGFGQRRLAAWLLGPRLDRVRREIFRVFVDGASPSSAALATKLDRSEREVTDDLVELGRLGFVEVSKAGAIVRAYPFSSEPTAHRVRLAGARELHACCAFAALGVTLLAGGTAQIRSRCPRTDRDLRVVLRRGRLVKQVPSGCVLAAPRAQKRTMLPFSSSSRFVASWAEAEAWSEEVPKGARVLSLRSAVLLARLVFDDPLRAPHRDPSTGENRPARVGRDDAASLEI